MINYFKSKKKLYQDALNKGYKKGKREERYKASKQMKTFKDEVEYQLKTKNKKISNMIRMVMKIEDDSYELSSKVIRAENALMRISDADLLRYREAVKQNSGAHSKKQEIINEALLSLRAVKKTIPELENDIEKFKIEYVSS
ncbi:MAG: hypothetical protein ACFFG0_02390 [Candidatus Thorarchaeota archaeon]